MLFRSWRATAVADAPGSDSAASRGSLFVGTFATEVATFAVVGRFVRPAWPALSRTAAGVAIGASWRLRPAKFLASILGAGTGVGSATEVPVSGLNRSCFRVVVSVAASDSRAAASLGRVLEGRFAAGAATVRSTCGAAAPCLAMLTASVG